MIHKLNLPDLSEMHKIKTKIPLGDIWKLSEERLPFLNSRQEYEQRRLRSKTGIKFTLYP